MATVKTLRATKFCWLEDIEGYLSKGWSLVSRNEMERLIKVDEMVAAPGAQGYSQTVATVRAVTVKTVGCLLALDEESPLAELEKMKQALLAAEAELKQARAAADLASARVKNLEERIQSNSVRHADRMLENQALTEANHRFECDLGKVRAAIGAIRFKEIVEG